jgi:hypothetical protein
VSDDTVVGRRAFLGAAGTTGAVALAGCLGGPRRLDWVGGLADSDGRERHQLFGPDRDVVFTVRQEAPREGARSVPFLATLHHRDGLRTDRLRLRLYAPSVGGYGPAVDVHVRSPPTRWWPPISLARNADGTTLVTVDGLGDTRDGHGAIGEANVAVPFTVVGAEAGAELHVGLEAMLSERSAVGRRRYEVGHTDRFPLVER